MSQTSTGGRRFQSLDVIRGVAALSVTVFHCVNTHPAIDHSAFGRALMYGWAGVFLFFPVSGYCIAAAVDRSENARFGAFLKRRWRRIYPPYWASIALLIAVGLMALPFNRGRIEGYLLPPEGWLAVLTLTHVFTPFNNALSPVYWSLCYEEQFYLLMALALVSGRRWRAPLITLLTVAAGIYHAVPSLYVKGIFLNYWLCFAVGYGVYLWLHDAAQRRYAAIIFAAAVVSTAFRLELYQVISLLTAAIMLWLGPRDERVAAQRWLRPLLAAGAISYSLYLTHVPIGGRVTSLLLRVNAPVWACAVVSTGVSIGVALIFFRLLERRFLPRASKSAAAAVPLAAAPAL